MLSCIPVEPRLCWLTGPFRLVLSCVVVTSVPFRVLLGLRMQSSFCKGLGHTWVQ